MQLNLIVQLINMAVHQVTRSNEERPESATHFDARYLQTETHRAPSVHVCSP